jgi:outer membrane protein assembly factor BamB
MATRSPSRSIDQLVFVGFRSRVVALDRETGALVWSWASPSGYYVALLIDGDRLIVSVSGYTYCLDPLTGQVLWYNPLEGMGTGAPCIASVRGGTSNPFSLLSYAATDDANQQAATT